MPNAKETESDKSESVGIILSGSSTKEANCQLLEEAEKGNIREGMLLLVEASGVRLLSRVAQIIPFNAFYTEGDPWSEARRKGLPIPKEIARQYEICKLDLLIQIPKSEIKYPPRPGDSVARLDPTKHEKDIFGVVRGERGFSWFGTLGGYSDAPIPLNIESVPMHLAVFGVTGSGKSFDMGALIERLSDIPCGGNKQISFPMMIVDAHGDYLDYVDHLATGNSLGEIGWMKRFVFPDQYLGRKEFRSELQGTVHPIAINLDVLPTRELAETIAQFYKGSTEGAEMYVWAIDQAMDALLDSGYDSMHSVFQHSPEQVDIALDQLQIHDQTRKAAKRALLKFRELEEKHSLLSTDSLLKERDFIDRLTSEGGVAVLDFSADGAPGVDLAVKQFVMTYLATVLFNRFTEFKTGGDERYLIFVIEEAQNFCPDYTYPIGSSLAHTRLSAIATQGRKFGLSLCLISQRPSFVDRIVLSMCNTFFIHRVSPEDVSFVRSVTGGLPSSLLPRLTTLGRGEMIVTGQMNVLPFPLLVRVNKDQRRVHHTAGKTNVIERLTEARRTKDGD